VKNPLVSIVICCHNRAHLLPQTMASVFAQEYEPVEIVVVDDGSTDGTPALMAGYGERVRYYWQENKGVSATRTTACQLARGEYIAFQDDDDLMPPDRIVALYDAIRQFPSAVFAVGDWAVIDDEGNFTGSRWLPARESEKPILFKGGYGAVLWPKVPAAPHTTLFRKVDGEQIGWFDQQFSDASEDKDFFARLGQLGPIVYVPKIVSYYRRGHDGSLTSNHVRVAYRQFLLFEKHLKSLGTEHRELRKRLQFRMLTALKRIALFESKCGELQDFRDDGYLERGLSLIGYRNRLSYHWATLLKFPIRKLILR